MKSEDKLIELHNVIVSQSMITAKTNEEKQLDVDSVLDAVEDAIMAISELKSIVSTIKNLTSNVKWYEFLKLFSIIQEIVKLIKSRNWDI